MHQNSLWMNDVACNVPFRHQRYWKLIVCKKGRRRVGMKTKLALLSKKLTCKTSNPKTWRCCPLRGFTFSVPEQNLSFVRQSKTLIRTQTKKGMKKGRRIIPPIITTNVYLFNCKIAALCSGTFIDLQGYRQINARFKRKWCYYGKIIAAKSTIPALSSKYEHWLILFHLVSST